MGDGVQITFRGDISDVVKKAQQIPGEVDRATRRGKRSWEGGPEAGTRDQYRKMAGMGDEAEKQDAARKKREQDQANRDYLKRLKWNSRIQEDQDRAAQKEAERASKAADWGAQFGKALENRLMSAIGPAAIAMKAIELGWGTVIDNIQSYFFTRGLKISSGTDPMSARAAEVFSGLGTATDDEAIAMLRNAQAQANAVAAGAQNANAYGFQYFGFGKEDIMRMRQEGINFSELTVAMAKKYKQFGGTNEFDVAASSIFGKNWRDLGVIQAEAYADRLGIRGIKKPGDVQSDIEGIGPNKSSQRIRASVIKQILIDNLTPGELMGGLGGGTKQMLSNVTSLQAMGGGDILSAIARGPQERIATATEQTAHNTSIMAGQIKVPTGGWFPPAPTTLRKH